MHTKKKTASKTINENLSTGGDVRNEPLREEPTTMDGDSNTDDGSVSESAASACTTTLSRPRDLFRPSGFVTTGAAAATMTKPRGGPRGGSSQQKQQQLPQIPSSMSLYSFRNVTATATMTKTSRNAKTPQGTPKYLDLSSPAASKQHFTMNSSASTHDFIASAAAADYTGKTRLSCVSYVMC